MKIKFLLAVIAFALLIFNFSFNVKNSSTSDTTLLALSKTAFAGTGECSLNPGDPVSGTSCTVKENIGGADWWWYTFNTATCDHNCSAGGSNCCLELE